LVGAFGAGAALLFVTIVFLLGTWGCTGAKNRNTTKMRDNSFF
jgi:hypothetical protein